MHILLGAIVIPLDHVTFGIAIEFEFELYSLIQKIKQFTDIFQTSVPEKWKNV